MTFTYDLSTDLGKIRLYIGDVYENQAMLTDEEIAVVTAQYSDNIEASVRCLDLAMAKLSRQPDSRSAAGLSANRGNKYEQLAKLKTELKKQVFASGGAGASGSLGPVLVGPNSISDKDSARDDTDREKSAFRRDQWTNTRS